MNLIPEEDCWEKLRLKLSSEAAMGVGKLCQLNTKGKFCGHIDVVDLEVGELQIWVVAASLDPSGQPSTHCASNVYPRALCDVDLSGLVNTGKDLTKGYL